MMGDTHALGGVAGWLTVAAVSHPTAGHLAAGTALAVAGALAPDVDHRSADAAQAARAGGALAAAAGVLAGLAHSVPYWPAIVAGGLILALLPWATRPRNGHYRGGVHSLRGLAVWLLLALGPCLLTAWPLWAATAMVTGWCSHLVLDAMTKEGLPLAWRPGNPGPRFGWLPKANSITTGGRKPRRRRGGPRARWRHRRRSGAEYWLVQPVLAGGIILLAIPIVGSYR